MLKIDLWATDEGAMETLEVGGIRFNNALFDPEFKDILKLIENLGGITLILSIAPENRIGHLNVIFSSLYVHQRLILFLWLPQIR